MGQLPQLSICLKPLAVNTRLYKRMENLSPKFSVRFPQKGDMIRVADWLTLLLLKQEPCFGSVLKGRGVLALSQKYKILRDALQRQRARTRWLLGFLSGSQVQVSSFLAWIKMSEWSLSSGLKRRGMMWRTHTLVKKVPGVSFVLFLGGVGCHLPKKKKTQKNQQWCFSDKKT